jgi:ABC-type antimicrobial peptide transport system permease subunit
MLGIILGVSSLVAMSALVSGMEKGAREALIAIGGLEKIRVEIALLIVRGWAPIGGSNARLTRSRNLPRRRVEQRDPHPDGTLAPPGR